MTAEAKAAVRAGESILGAYDRGILDIRAPYLAETLRMLIEAVKPVITPLDFIEVRTFEPQSQEGTR